jgi:hypothetical protein
LPGGSQWQVDALIAIGGTNLVGAEIRHGGRRGEHDMPTAGDGRRADMDVGRAKRVSSTCSCSCERGANRP